MKSLIAVAALIVFANAPRLAHAAPSTSGYCSTPPYHQFDFWLGDWDTFDVGVREPSQARNRVTRILGGCVVHERYAGSNGLIGESFSIYDAVRKVWHQTWVTNRGHLLVVEGGMHDGRMMLQGRDRDTDGKPIDIRVSWWRVPDGVRERSVASNDGGKTWKTQFDIEFRHHH
jgi:hypothetical protein